MNRIHGDIVIWAMLGLTAWGAILALVTRFL